MGINWQVRGVDDETINNIKDRAKQRGLPVGKYLNWHFMSDVGMLKYDSSKKLKTYRIKLSPQIMSDLKNIAAEHGLGVAQYIEMVITKNK